MYTQGVDYKYTCEAENSINKGRLQVFGQGSVNAVPDKAQISIGVITENEQLETAQKENAGKTQQVIDSIRTIGVPSKNLQTKNYSIVPKYDYVEGRQIFRGYTVTNELNVIIDNMDTVGQIIDAAVKAGANSVNNITFLVSDTSKYYNEALKLALKDAQSKAIVIASRLKIKLNIIPAKITEQGSSTILPVMMSLKASQTVTPIEAGENKIIANIVALFYYKE